MPKPEFNPADGLSDWKTGVVYNFSGKFWKPAEISTTDPNDQDFQSLLLQATSLGFDGVRKFDNQVNRLMTQGNATGVFLAFTRSATTGFWKGFRLDLTIPSPYFLGIPNISFFGGLFGNTLGNILGVFLSGNFDYSFNHVWKSWLNMTLSDSEKFYEISNFRFTVVDSDPSNTKTSSISNISEEPLRLYLAKKMSEDSDFSQQVMQDSSLPLKTRQNLRLALHMASVASAM